MRKSALLLAIALLSIAIAACSPPQRSDDLQESPAEVEYPAEDDGEDSGKASSGNAPEGEAPEPNSARPPLVYVDGWPENEFTSDVPVPHFGTEPYEVVIDEYYGEVTARWEGVSADEAWDYLDEVKAAGFTVEAIELGDGTAFDYFAFNNGNHDKASVVEISYHYGGRLEITVANIRAIYELDLERIGGEH